MIITEMEAVKDYDTIAEEYRHFNFIDKNTKKKDDIRNFKFNNT